MLAGVIQEAAMLFWLMKSEPGVYSIDNLERDRKTSWEGVRNYQARNFMRDDMKIGDPVLFYHSNASPSGVAGLARVASMAYPDSSAFARDSRYYDEKGNRQSPVWFMVDVEFVARFSAVVSLETIKSDPLLKDIMVARRGARLSIQPVSEDHFARICQLGGFEKMIWKKQHA